MTSERAAADEAYANSAFIPDGEAFFARWAAQAEAFRGAREGRTQLGLPYGADPRQTFDLFMPDRAAPKGCVVIVHGGYWMACSPRDFSHLAQGAIEAGFACAIPSYRLAPQVRIAQITQDIKAALGRIADAVSGPLYLTGHSAGGHLVARMLCDDGASGLGTSWLARVKHVMPISPLSDLAPLMVTSMNDTLRIDAAEVTHESPIHHKPHQSAVTVWVGGAERPAFLDQARWLARAWGAGHVVDEGRHHFDVIEGLQNASSPMMRSLLGAELPR